MVSVQGTGRRLLDRYALVELLGHSSTALVWRARDERAGRDVAVKEFRLPPMLDDVEQAVLAKKLVRIGGDAARFSHPGVVEVYDVFEESGTPFVVMELFDDPTLAQVVTDRGTLAPEVAADIGRQLLAILTAAHAIGVVHRGVRPGNVVLVNGTTARLADFATASVVPDPEGARSPFSAPEQTATTGAGPAADLWSLGATLHFAVEGTPPAKSQGGAPEVPADGGSALTPVLDALLTRDPLFRPDAATAAQLLDDAAGPRPSAEVEADSDVPSEDPTADEEGPETAEHPEEPGAPPAESSEADDDDTDAAAPSTMREPWFFPVPVEVQPGSKLVTLKAAAAGETPPPKVAPTRFGGAPWVAVLAVGMSLFLLVALVLTQSTGVLNLGESTTKVVPADWVGYEEPVSGYQISHPSGWKVTRFGPATEISDPAGEALLRVETTPPSGLSPRATALSLEKAFAADTTNYQRVRMVTSRFHDYPASVWEYTYTDDGQEMRAIQLGILTETQRITLLFQTKAADWQRYQRELAGFEASFKGF